MNLLILENSLSDFRIIQQLIEQARIGETQILHCERLSDALRLSDQFLPDVILADLNLPDSGGLETVEKIHHRFPQAALIVLSGTADESLATLLVQGGVQDYLVKEQVNPELLRSAVCHALECKRIESELHRRGELERRATEAQSSSEYAYRMLVEHSLQELLIFQDGRVVFANPIASAQSGYTLAELLEMTPEEIRSWQYPEDRLRIAGVIEDLLGGKTNSQRIEYRRFNKDGSVSWMDALYTLIQYGGRPAIQVVQLDVTERKLVESRLKRRLEMESLVIGISTRFIDIAADEVDHEIQQALRIMGEFADVDRCYVCALGQNEPRIIHEYCWQAPGVSQKPLEMTGFWLANLPWLYEHLQHKEFVHVFSLDDLPNEARAEKAFWIRQDVCSLLIVPLIRGGQLAGFLGMDTLRHERHWVDEDLTLLKLMSEVLSNALSAKWTEETLRKSEAQYRLLADSIQDVIGLHKMDGTILFLSPSAEKVFGWKVADHLGSNLFDEIARDNDVYMVQEVRDRLSKGQDAVFEWRYPANGNFIWVETLAHPILDKEKKPEQWVSTSREITERRQARLALQSAHDRLKASIDGLQQRFRDSEMLLEMGDLLQSCLTVQDVYDVVKVFCRRFFPESDGALYMISSQLGLLENVMSWGEAVPVETNFPREECWAMRRGRPQTFRQTGTSLPCRHVTRQGVDYLCAPLILQGEAAGLLHLRCGGMCLDERFQQLAAMIAERVALAMTGIILRETLRTQSIRDPLTGLFNRRYLMETMTREFSRATRRHHTVGVIMIDIDHFKVFNDTYGHDAGDVLLQALSNYLLKSIRGEDLPCRYGGEEFILMLPEATLEDSVKRAEELRKGIAGIKVVHKGITLKDMTVSIGVAVYPEHGDTVEVILKSADLALYRAKQEGRNRIALPPLVP